MSRLWLHPKLGAYRNGLLCRLDIRHRALGSHFLHGYRHTVAHHLTLLRPHLPLQLVLQLSLELPLELPLELALELALKLTLKLALKLSR